MAVEPLPAAQSADRPFSCLDQMKRIKAAPHTDDYKSKTLPYSTVIHVGIFFDGTNNKKRDQEAVFDCVFSCPSSMHRTLKTSKRIGSQRTSLLCK
ncbi:MAG TPA: hypothetical protein VIO83_09730 [Pseudomonas sp.]